MPDDGMNHDNRQDKAIPRTRRRRNSALHRVRPKVVPNQSDDSIAKLADEGNFLYRIFEVTDLDQDAVIGLTMVNEDYYLSDEELIEYYTPGAMIRELDFFHEKIALRPVNDLERDLLAVEVLVDGVPIGYVDPKGSAYVYRYLEDARIVNVRVLLGGGRYKQIVRDDSEELQEQPDDLSSASYDPKDVDTTEQENQHLSVRSCNIPVYAYVCMAIRRDYD